MGLGADLNGRVCVVMLGESGAPLSACCCCDGLRVALEDKLFMSACQSTRVLLKGRAFTSGADPTLLECLSMFISE